MASIDYLLQIMDGGKEAVFAAAKSDPKIAPKRKPTLDQVTIAVVKQVEALSVAGGASLVREALQDAYDMYTINNGEHPNAEGSTVAEDVEAWEEGVDDAVEEVFKPYADVLSNDWMATHTIDTALWEEGAVDKLAVAFGKEVYKQLCWQTGEGPTAGKLKSPQQILANAGVLTSDILSVFGDRIVEAGEAPQTPPHDATSPQPPIEDGVDVEGVVRLVYAHIGAGYDVDDVQAEFELCVDSDDILAQGAGARLGLNESDVLVLQMYGLDQGPAAVPALMSMLADFLPPAEGEAAPPAPPAPTVPKAPAPTGDALPSSVFAGLQAHSAIAASAMAEKIGVSRATYNNYVNGKTELKATDEQRAAIREQVIGDVNGLLQVLATLDGAQAMAVA